MDKYNLTYSIENLGECVKALTVGNDFPRGDVRKISIIKAVYDTPEEQK